MRLATEDGCHVNCDHTLIEKLEGERGRGGRERGREGGDEGEGGKEGREGRREGG